MPSILSVMGPITDIPQQQLTCHVSTFYWLYKAVYGIGPNLDQYSSIGGKMMPPQPKMMEMVRQSGKKLDQPSSGLLQLMPGSIIVFVRNDEARHSCVAMNGQQFMGYNQTGWFKTPGIPNGRTVHGVADLKWKTGHERNYLTTDVGDCRLYSVPEGKAKMFLERQ